VPSRKQRRRRDKTFRHEYGLVTTDEEGNEVEVASTELRKKEAPNAKTRARGGGSKRPVREVPPPSWRRALRRGGLMGAFLLVVMVALLHAPIPVALLYALVLIPFTYGIDRFSYRTYLRRSGKQP
jgi:hypothetical protein